MNDTYYAWRSMMLKSKRTFLSHGKHPLLWSGLIAVLSSFASLGPSNAQGKYEEFSLDGRRLPDFYISVSEADPQACRAILSSVNGEYRIDDGKLDDNPRVSLESDVLLHSDLQVGWTRRRVDESDAQSHRVTSFDVAQAELGSRRVTLFRRGLGKFMAETGATLSVDRLWMSELPTHPMPSDRHLTPTDVAGVIRGSEIRVDIGESTRPKLAVSSVPQPSFPATLLNVVSVKNDLYVLAIDAFEAEIRAPKPPMGPVELLVFQLLPNSGLRQACHFRSS